MTKLNTMTDENPINETQQSGDSAASQGGDANGAAFEPLTASYERLRHSTDSAELSEFARRPLPDRSDQAAFSRATALLEAVAGNKHTPVEDRVFLASTMPFPNVLVKLSVDPEPSVRVAVAANEDDKNWLVGRLTKDPIPEVRDAALRNKRTSGRCGSRVRRIPLRTVKLWIILGCSALSLRKAPRRCFLPWFVVPWR